MAFLSPYFMCAFVHVHCHTFIHINLYIFTLVELLEDDVVSDYDTNATLKAKILYKSCIDTGKLYNTHAQNLAVSERFVSW